MMRELNLTNGIKTCIKKNANTPRVALSMNFSIARPEEYPGQYLLMNRLLLKGTKKYSSEELSAILDENAIDLYTEMKYDYLRFRFVALNEDFECALSILSDIIQNSTFEEFEKEKTKLKGEILAELDSAKVKVSDLFTKTIYKDHFYGHSYTTILNEIDNVTIDDIKSAYQNILTNSKKTLVLVGDVDTESAELVLNKHLNTLPASVNVESLISEPEFSSQNYVELIKDDAQQAQIIQGWRVASICTEDYPRLMLLNVILGASGLSSRLFLELREKKGLAYTVRSSYETYMKSAVFSIYIGTEPSNIQTSIDGFKEEIEKIKTVLVSEEELNNAKNNIIGKQQFITETNAQQANLMAYYAITDRSFDYQKTVIDALKQVTAEELLECANKYFNDDYVLAILKP
ncbi:MAG: insulinase family protein [Cyanobacteria bacterium SIG31]|nr:insulinase family protein [Cyanobacteria bacterium SIG31]